MVIKPRSIVISMRNINLLNTCDAVLQVACYQCITKYNIFNVSIRGKAKPSHGKRQWSDTINRTTSRMDISPRNTWLDLNELNMVEVGKGTSTELEVISKLNQEIPFEFWRELNWRELIPRAYLYEIRGFSEFLFPLILRMCSRVNLKLPLNSFHQMLRVNVHITITAFLNEWHRSSIAGKNWWNEISSRKQSNIILIQLSIRTGWDEETHQKWNEATKEPFHGEWNGIQHLFEMLTIASNPSQNESGYK